MKQSMQERYRQGELVIQRVDDATPCGAEVPAEEGMVILAHSETGHHHFIREKDARLFETGEVGVRICKVGAGGAVVEHARPGGHRPERLQPGGTYEISRKRQWTPEGWETVRD